LPTGFVCIDFADKAFLEALVCLLTRGLFVTRFHVNWSLTSCQ